jgi:hypothetical protein
MHHYRIRLARLSADRALLQQAIADMHNEAIESRNPAALALAQRLSEERSASSELPFELDPWLEVTEPSTPEVPH